MIVRKAQKYRDLARQIDHSCCRAEATPADFQRLCEEAREYEFRAVSINSGFVSQCRRLLEKSRVVISSTIGYPLGATTTDVKVYECKRAAADGADEFEVVMAIGHLRGGNYSAVEREIETIVRVANGGPVRVIIDACLLSKEELILACKLAKNAGALGVKTSTGFGGGTTTLDHVRVMRNTVGVTIDVTASGGIRTSTDAEKFLVAGANIIGTSSGLRIISGQDCAPGSDRD